MRNFGLLLTDAVYYVCTIYLHNQDSIESFRCNFYFISMLCSILGG